ncbi:MAG: hypothetical protein HY872_15030 [Chloroflexi bacterium]|nr:hypothetical protein [Chloroflexota bacterium]
MNLPQPVANFCRNNGYGQTRRATPLGGGSPNSGPLFVKLNPGAPPAMFERKAEGLIALAAPYG